LEKEDCGAWVSLCERSRVNLCEYQRDLFHAHIGGMDTFARGLKIAAAIRADGELDRWLRDRYASWSTGVGAEIEAGKHDFKSLERHMLAKGDIIPNKAAGTRRLRIW